MLVVCVMDGTEHRVSYSNTTPSGNLSPTLRGAIVVIWGCFYACGSFWYAEIIVM